MCIGNEENYVLKTTIFITENKHCLSSLGYELIDLPMCISILKMYPYSLSLLYQS